MINPTDANNKLKKYVISFRTPEQKAMQALLSSLDIGKGITRNDISLDHLTETRGVITTVSPLKADAYRITMKRHLELKECEFLGLESRRRV